MKYKLIKEYPGSPKLGTILTHKELQYCNWNEYYQEVVEKDYEILSMKCNKSSLLHFNNVESSINFMLKNDYSVHSVKRNDGEIFTIGDKVVGYNNSIAKIKTIDLVGEISLNIGTDKHEGFSLKNLKKAKHPLFTSEDGVDIFAGMSFYYVCQELELYNTICCTDEKKYKNAKQFSTKEKAEEYILLNKPCLSYGDVQEYLKVKDCNKVLDLVQSKIQQSV